MKTIFKLIIIVPIFCTFLIAVIFIGAGVYESFLGVYGILNGQIGTEARPGVMLFQALDIFLLAFLFLVFSIGFAQLFIPKPSRIMSLIDSITPDWLRVENFTQLKLILWDTVLTTLVVFFLGVIVREEGEYDWQTTIIPLSVLLISLSKYLIKRGK